MSASHEATPETDPASAEITDRLREWIAANHALRNNPASWRACRPPPDTEAGKQYARDSEAYVIAYTRLWMATDITYDESKFRDAVWCWRYWKVMAQKCCWYQLKYAHSQQAGETMARLHEAEARMAAVCGLADIYRSPCSYIEEQFPNLKQNK